MKQVPFKVSARAARLIGRENVSNADGAIIELIKNAYDADATICVVIFDIKYYDIPKILTTKQYNALEVDEFEKNLLINSYKQMNNNYELISVKESVRMQLFAIFSRQNRIYIIDNGDGMSDKIIENHWMTIGTNNKEVEFESRNKRVRTGAKGIGRFALDRLGNRSRMITIPRGKTEGFDWKVKWSDFEQTGVNLDEVYAVIDNTTHDLFYSSVIERLLLYPNTDRINYEKVFRQGTVIEISELRDTWGIEDIKNIHQNLEILTPPQDGLEFEYFEDESEIEDHSDVDAYLFKMYLFTSIEPDKFGRVRTSICDDFDYKLTAEYNEDKNLIVTIHRNEFNLELLDRRLFQYPEMKQWPFDQNTLVQGNFTKKYTLPQLIPGNNDSQFDSIGPFQFTIYFMKRTLQQKDKERLFQREFSSSSRSEWLDNFGGIKIFRDSFRVRPYGEAGGSSFDWLMLGERAAKSPAGITHRSGSWKVRPNQIAGLIRISRINNINFEDKSSREGIQETPEFQTFKLLLLRIIQLFEDDRQTIMRHLDQLYEEVNEQALNKDKAKKVAEKVVLEDAKKTSLTLSKEETEKNNNERSFLAKQVLAFSREREELITELKLLKGLASTGLIITSFAHELKNLSANILPRTQDLRSVLQSIISNDEVEKLKKHNNPFIMIEDFRNQDQRLKHWLDIALNVIRKDKRTRKKVDLFMMFEEYERTWSAALAFQSVELTIPKPDLSKRCMFRMFPIDFDSIFNNLLSNSLDAFQRKDALNTRQIKIGLNMEEGKLVFSYEDSGPGLLSTIDNPYRIFDSFFTTKLDAIGRPVGTGLGMWIVKTTIDEYRGQIELVKTRPGFKLKIKLPLRKDEGIIDYV